MNIDLSKDPYGRRYFAKMRRLEFEKLKKSNGFKHWRVQQVKIQKNRCAYCEIDLGRTDIVTHIDHVQPLYYEGKNVYSNFVLACKECNVKKWISDKRVVPDWIRENEKKFKEQQRLKTVRWRQHKQMEELALRELDEQIAQELSWIRD